MDEEIEAFTLESLPAMKKILMGKGALEGFFYFAAGKGASGLCVTLARKDKQGAKVLKIGKRLRKAIKGSKFSRGKVTTENKRLYLEVVKGTAKAKLIKTTCKKTLSELDGLAFLKRVVVFDTGNAPVEDDEDEPDRVTQDALVDAMRLTREDFDDTPEGEEEFQRFLAFQNDGVALDGENRIVEQGLEGFLDEASVLEDYLDALGDAESPEERREARLALGEALFVGADPLSGATLSPAVLELVRVSLDSTVASLGAYLHEAAREASKRLVEHGVGFASAERAAKSPEAATLRDHSVRLRATVLSYRDQLTTYLSAEEGT